MTDATGARVAVDVGCTTVVAAAQERAGAALLLLRFADEDGPPGTLTASLTWSADGSTRAGIEADRALDVDPHRGVRGPLAQLESGSSTLELEAGPVPVVALVAELLARPLRLATRELGAEPAQAVLTIPSAWPADGRRARALLAAAAIAGLPPATLVASAVAAAELAREPEPATVLVCDVGGRSCALSLVELGDGPGRLLATTELVVGADLFDELLYLDVLRELGDSDPQAAARLEAFHLHAGSAAGDDDSPRWAACQAGLARAVRHAREALTDAATHELVIADPVGVTLTLERERVRDLLLAESLVLAGTAREQIAQAGLTGALPSGRAGRVRVLLVGGGGCTPGLRDTLEAELDVPVVLADDPVTVVARGALPAADRAAAAASLPPRPRTAPAPRAPVAVRQALRTVLDDVVAAAMSGNDVVAVVRHDSHHRVVRVDERGRVSAAVGIDADLAAVTVTATAASFVVWGGFGASVFSSDLRPLTTIERPLLAAAGATSVWIASAGAEQVAVLDLTTLAISEREARVVEVQRLGLTASEPAVRVPRRGVRSPPPGARATVAGDRLLFAVPARGRGGRSAQRVGEAGPSGLGPVDTRAGPEWVIGLAPAAAGFLILTASEAATTLSLGEARLSGWPAGVRVRLAAHGLQAPWIVAARQTRWEALRVDGEQVVSVRRGDGTVERIGADADGLWLVCESAGQRRIVRVAAGGELHRLAALGAPLEPLGRSGAEILALAGPPGAARALVAITPG